MIVQLPDDRQEAIIPVSLDNDIRLPAADRLLGAGQYRRLIALHIDLNKSYGPASRLIKQDKIEAADRDFPAALAYADGAEIGGFSSGL